MWIKLNYGDMYIKVQMVAKNEKKQQHYDITERGYKYDGWLFGVTISGREKKSSTQRDFHILCQVCLVFKACVQYSSAYLLVFLSFAHCRLSILTIRRGSGGCQKMPKLLNQFSLPAEIIFFLSLPPASCYFI